MRNSIDNVLLEMMAENARVVNIELVAYIYSALFAGEWIDEKGRGALIKRLTRAFVPDEVPRVMLPSLMRLISDGEIASGGYRLISFGERFVLVDGVLDKNIKVNILYWNSLESLVREECGGAVRYTLSRQESPRMVIPDPGMERAMLEREEISAPLAELIATGDFIGTKIMEPSDSLVFNLVALVWGSTNNERYLDEIVTARLADSHDGTGVEWRFS